MTAKNHQQHSLLRVENLSKHFPVHGGVFYRQVAKVHAVDGVSFSVPAGSTLGIVGESGCGKSTLGRTILRLYEPTAGSITYDGVDIAGMSAKGMRALRREMQMVFQDPYESLNPRHSIQQILEEPFLLHNQHLSDAERREAIMALLQRVGLPENALERYPHEFSGGQRQRIGIARAISQNPRLVICDEPVSALDVSIQSQVVNLLLSLQAELKLTYIFIAHDLAVVRHMADEIAVMYLGKIVEKGPADEVYYQPGHPYARALIASIPKPMPGRKVTAPALEGELPSPLNPPQGCRFHTRCPHAVERCRREEPLLAPRRQGSESLIACHRTDDI